MARQSRKKKNMEEKREIPPEFIKADTPKAEPEPRPATEKAAPKPAPMAYRLTDANAFGRNMARVAVKSQQLMSEFLQRQADRVGSEPIDPLNVTGAYFALMRHMADNPGQIFTAQLALWRDYLTLLQRTTQRAMGQTVEPLVTPAAGDRRFRDKDW